MYLDNVSRVRCRCSRCQLSAGFSCRDNSGLEPQSTISETGEMGESLDGISESFHRELLVNLEGVRQCLMLLSDTGQLTGVQREYVGVGTQYVATLRALLEGSAECARIDRGQFASMAEKTDLNELLNSVAKPHHFPLTERGTELGVKIGAEIPPVLVLDRIRLQLVLSNLLCTALNLPISERIDIETKRSTDNSENIVFVVTCSIWISYEQKETLPPLQESVSSDPGLSIAQKLAKILGWQLTVRTQGNTVAFLVELPENPDRKVSCLEIVSLPLHDSP